MGRSRRLLVFLAFALCALGVGVTSAPADAPHVTAPEASEISSAGSPGPNPEFTDLSLDPPAALAPGVTTLRAFPLEGGTRALAGGPVDPRDSATEYWVEYGPGSSGAYSSSTPHASAGAGGTGELVRQEISGLTPGGTYHFRLVAENSEGARTDGEDQVFAMPASAPEPSGAECPNSEYRVGPARDLPDCRAYELASPPEGEGLSADPLLETVGPAAHIGRWGAVSTDGSAVLWRTMVSPPSANGTGLWDFYVSSRATGAWRSTNLSPPARGVGTEPPHPLFATPDLKRILYRTFDATFDPSDHDPVEVDTPDLQYQDLYGFSTDGTFVHVNRGSIEVPVEGEEPFFRGSSEDLSKVVFTDLRPLEPGMAPSTSGVGYIYWTDGQTTKVVGDGAEQNVGDGGVMGVSADGSTVVIQKANTLWAWSAGSGESTELLNLASDPNVDAVSRDGTKIFLTTAETLTAGDTDTSRDLYVYDTDTSEVTLLSAPTVGSRGNSDACAASLPELSGCGVSPVIESSDGSQAYFVSPEQIVEGEGINGGVNLYLSRQGEISFVATLDPTDPVYPQAIPGGVSREYRTRDVRLTPDESKLIFESRAPLTSYDNAGYREVYLFDPGIDALVCASCRPDGSPPTAESELLRADTHALGPSDPYYGLSGSANSDEHGERIFFGSRDDIVGGDINDRRDVYEYDVATGSSSLISSGTGARESLYLGNGVDGRDVYFITADTLEGRDKNGSAYKVYDAREGGGFPPPPTPPPACEADVCQGPQSAPPATSAPGSIGFSGRGNIKHNPRNRCGKKARKVRRAGKSRCVGKHQKKHPSKKRDAKRNRRTVR